MPVWRQYFLPFNKADQAVEEFGRLFTGIQTVGINHAYLLLSDATVWLAELKSRKAWID